MSQRALKKPDKAERRSDHTAPQPHARAATHKHAQLLASTAIMTAQLQHFYHPRMSTLASPIPFPRLSPPPPPLVG